MYSTIDYTVSQEDFKESYSIAQIIADLTDGQSLFCFALFQYDNNIFDKMIFAKLFNSNDFYINLK
jgi:hypothetical protein